MARTWDLRRVLKWIPNSQADPAIGAIQIAILNCTVLYAKFIKKKGKRLMRRYLMGPPLLELQVDKLNFTHQLKNHAMHGGHARPQRLQPTLQNQVLRVRIGLHERVDYPDIDAFLLLAPTALRLPTSGGLMLFPRIAG